MPGAKRQRRFCIYGLSSFLVLATVTCARPSVAGRASQALQPIGTYQILVRARRSWRDTDSLISGVIVLSPGLLPQRTVRALKVREGWGSSGNGIDPARANGCIRWAPEDTAHAPTPAFGTIRWSRVDTQWIYVHVYFHIDYGYALRLRTDGLDTLRGVGSSSWFRLASDPVPSGDSVLFIRRGAPDPSKCLSR
jgi:hypothetical protein